MPGTKSRAMPVVIASAMLLATMPVVTAIGALLPVDGGGRPRLQRHGQGPLVAQRGCVPTSGRLRNAIEQSAVQEQGDARLQEQGDARLQAVARRC